MHLLKNHITTERKDNNRLPCIDHHLKIEIGILVCLGEKFEDIFEKFRKIVVFLGAFLFKKIAISGDFLAMFKNIYVLFPIEISALIRQS